MWHNGPLQIVPLKFEDLYYSRKFTKHFWKKNSRYNSERSFSDPKVQILWLEKVYFMARAMEANYFNTETFIWIDSGLLRTDDWFDVDRYKKPKNFTFSSNAYHLARVFDNSHAYLNSNGIYDAPSIGFGGGF